VQIQIQSGEASVAASAPHQMDDCGAAPTSRSRRWVLRVLPGAAVGMLTLLALTGCGGNGDEEDDEDDEDD
jgi:hypothetical protein